MFSSVRVLLLSALLPFALSALSSGAETVITVPLQVRDVSSGEATETPSCTAYRGRSWYFVPDNV